MRRGVLVAAMAVAAAGLVSGAAVAAPGQCKISGYDAFPCEVVLDGGGITFGLPDGQTFAFALTGADEGQGYLIAADAEPGERPDEMGSFTKVPGEDGCWSHDEDLTFCVLVEQAP